MKRFGFAFNLGAIIDAPNIEKAKEEVIKNIKKADYKDLVDALELKYIQNENGEYEYEADDLKDVQ